MDSAYLIEVGALLLRWLHLIVGIAWIGSSFYFVWLDNSLRPPTDPDHQAKGVGGELWAVHGGGFYNPQKYLVAPKHLPSDLHWFKWESYSTWLTGFFLLGVLYYSQAATYMVDPAKAALAPGQAIGIGVATLVGGWLVYDGLCRLLMQRSLLLFGALYFAFVVAVAFGLTHLLSGRAAFLHVGAMIATTMSANVFFWIIPGQKKTVAAMQRGDTPDPIHGQRAKQRSVHNNYLTLPVLFCMISNHYAFTYSHPQAWAVLALIFLAAVLIRHFFNLRHKGVLAWQYPAAGAALLAGVFIWLAPAPPGRGRQCPDPGPGGTHHHGPLRRLPRRAPHPDAGGAGRGTARYAGTHPHPGPPGHRAGGAAQGHAPGQRHRHDPGGAGHPGRLGGGRLEMILTAARPASHPRHLARIGPGADGGGGTGRRQTPSGAFGRPTLLQGRHELVFDIPGEVDPLVLVELLDAQIHHLPAHGLGVKRGEEGLGQELANHPGGIAGIHQIVDEQEALAVVGHPLEDFHCLAQGLGAGFAGRLVAGGTDGVHQADFQFPGDQGGGNEAAPGDGDDALEGALVQQLVAQQAGIPMQFRPGNHDVVPVGAGGRMVHDPIPRLKNGPQYSWSQR